MVNYKDATKFLQKNYPDATEIAIINRSGKNLFSAGKWSINGEIKKLLSNWASGTAQSITLGGIRYSILQMAPERFVGTNRKKKGHLVGAATPSGDIYIIAHISAKSKGWFHEAYPVIARAAAMMETGVKINTKTSKNVKAPSKPKKKKREKSNRYEIEESSSMDNMIESMNNNTTVLLQQRAQVNPILKLEIDSFLQWLKDPQGLSNYISYYVQHNDSSKISQLAYVYNKLYSLFY
ncbi:MAG: hypothetical protein KGD63_13845 [Candidatus Lokiarchaeota archaeon]|nr:hypothetical protein [Candidatus Lokiarchaeota archaeon]